jgi:hypothetical protein
LLLTWALLLALAACQGNGSPSVPTIPEIGAPIPLPPSPLGTVAMTPAGEGRVSFASAQPAGQSDLEQLDTYYQTHMPELGWKEASHDPPHENPLLAGTFGASSVWRLNERVAAIVMVGGPIGLELTIATCPPAPQSECSGSGA